MKKIAMLNCMKTAKTCSGSGCFRAFNERAGGFSDYGDEPLTITAFFRCSSCEKTVADDPDMLKKLNRVVEVGTEAVHIGACAQHDGVRCAFMAGYAAWLEEHGVKVIWKTH